MAGWRGAVSLFRLRKTDASYLPRIRGFDLVKVIKRRYPWGV